MDDHWLDTQRRNLRDFGRLGYDPQQGGFGRLQADGTLDQSRGLETWVNCRALYCYALDVLVGHEDSLEWVEKSADTLATKLWDDKHGGWYTGVSPESEPHTEGRKEAYTHSFVLLAASALKAVNSSYAEIMFDRISSVISEHFWSEQESATLESWDRSFSAPEAYRGANSNMHMTEASLAAFDMTNDPRWLHRGIKMVDTIIGANAREMNWRIPEHYHPDWSVDLVYNEHDPNHPFRPFGATPGHGFEWSRLIVQLSSAMNSLNLPVPQGYREAAEGLFARALEDGWERNGHPGLCYTTDFEGKVVNSLHLAWVTCEALSAAIVLERECGGADYAHWVERLWNFSDEFLVDREHGGWRTELDSANKPSQVVWGDKPDFYHPFQSVLIPRATTGPSLLKAFS